MAAYILFVFLLWVHPFVSTTTVERRFSDFKRCADEECSMLLCRGKAVSDFTGPDCRFLAFKKSETIYVYYKLSGRRTNLWAGSVGSRFGYFSSDLLAVNHIYTDKELEIPAEETDFVCFDTGHDKFDSYDIDSLLGSSLTTGKDDMLDQVIEENIDAETELLIGEAESESSEIDNNDLEITSHDIGEVSADQDRSASLHQIKINKILDPEVGEADTEVKQSIERKIENVLRDQASTAAFNDNGDSSETKDAPFQSEREALSRDVSASFSEGRQVPELKTTLGTTFDAVTTDDEETSKVTPYEEVESEDHTDEDNDFQRETPLLSFSQDASTFKQVHIEESVLNEEKSTPATHADKEQASEDKNMWSSLGDKVFAIVSGGERTDQVSSSEEDDDDDEEEGEVHSDKHKNVVRTEKGISLLTTNPVLKQDETKPLSVVHDQSKSDFSEAAVQAHPEEVAETLAFQDDIGPGYDHYKEDKSALSTDDQMEKMEPTMVEKPESLQGGIVNLQPQSQETPVESIEQESMKDEEFVEFTGLLTDHLEEIRSKESHQELPEGNNELKKEELENEQIQENSIFNENHEYLNTDLEKNETMNDHQELPVEEVEVNEQLPIKEADSQEDNIGDESQDPDVEELEESLLDDENALQSTLQHELPSQTQTPPSVGSDMHRLPNSELGYSEDVLRLTLLREHFSENVIERLHTLLGLKNLFSVEAMFSDLEQELKTAVLSNGDTPNDIEKVLESIFEASETSILDEIEIMLDGHGVKNTDSHQMEVNSFDEEAAILEDFQELAFKLRQKYSTTSDSGLFASPSDTDIDEVPSDVMQGELMLPLTDEDKFEDNLTDTVVNDNHIKPEVDDGDDHTGANMDGNFTVTELVDNHSFTEVKEEFELDQLHKEPDIGIKDDGGYFNKNEDNQQSFKATEDKQSVPQAFLDNHLEGGLGLEIEHPSSGPLDSQPVSGDFVEEESGLFLVGMFYFTSFFSLIKTKVVQYSIVVISLLPEDWKPAPMFFGWPWQPVVTTAAIGVVSIMLFFWRTVMSIKKKEYLVNEKGLNDQIEALKKQKNEAVKKISELQIQAEDYKDKQMQSEETTSYALLKIKELESLVSEVEARNEKLSEEKKLHAKFIDEERVKTQTHEIQIEKLEKSKEKLQLSRKKTQEALTKTTILLDEAKIHEDTRNVQHKRLERDHASLQEQNKSLKAAIKGWEDKHKELREQIKAYQKSQKELEDSVALKDHNVEVLSELLADLDACDLQKSDGRLVANGGTADEKTDIKNRIKQMMDVSRVQMTLSVVEEERDRFMAKLLNEEKARKELEEHHQVLEHSIVTLKSEKSHVENQLKVLQQKNEIMTEMYQQKENALQQKLTKEELERRSKETMLSEVGGKALVAEEEVKLFRQRIEEIREEMKKTEASLKEQIKEQESKTHEHWVTARTAERNLSEEKKETPHLRSQLAVLTSQLNERRAPLFRPNPGQFMSARQGSYGPSPVSGGAPSPPLMIEGPRRPPSAPVGRRSDPFGPRPPSDPHGRYPDNKYSSGTDMIAPRTSSPTNMDGSTVPVESETQVEASRESPEPMSSVQGPGSFLASPIRDTPGPIAQGPLLASGPHGLPPPRHKFIRAPNQGPHGPHIMGPVYPPGPGMTGQLGQPSPNGPPPHGQPLPANGHPGMRPPGPMGEHPFGPRPSNGHAFRPRPGHDMVDLHFAPPPLPPLRFRPPAHHYGPMHPLHVTHGPMGPRPPFPLDMHFQGPRDHPYPPHHLPPGAPVQPPLTRGGSFGQPPPEANYDSSEGPHHGPAQNFPSQQGPAPQEPASSAMAEP